MDESSPYSWASAPQMRFGKIDDLVSAKLPDMVDANEVKRHPPGMKAVVVNGATVVEDGQCLDVFPGKVRRQQLCLAH